MNGLDKATRNKAVCGFVSGPLLEECWFPDTQFSFVVFIWYNSALLPNCHVMWFFCNTVILHNSLSSLLLLPFTFHIIIIIILFIKKFLIVLWLFVAFDFAVICVKLYLSVDILIQASFWLLKLPHIGLLLIHFNILYCFLQSVLDCLWFPQLFQIMST